MAKGFIYILINPAYKGLLKVGKTTRTSEERAEELSKGTGIPTPFAVAYDIEVEDCNQIEKDIHMRLAQYRYSQDREFFRMPLKQAIKELNIAVEEYDSLHWWDSLSVSWKEVFKRKIANSDFQKKEDIEKVFDLTEVSISNENGLYFAIDNLEPLLRLPKLLNLAFIGTDVTDYSILEKLPKLQSLTCMVNSESQLEQISQALSIEDLILSVYKIINLQPLELLTALRSISISIQANHAMTFEFLRYLPELCDVQITVNDKSESVYSTFLLNNTLETIYLTNICFRDSSSIQIANIESIESITFINCKGWDKEIEEIDRFSLKFLQNAETLQVLSLEKSKFCDIQYLSNLINLQSLILSETDIFDLSPLVNIKSLKYLGLKNMPLLFPSQVRNFQIMHPECVIDYSSSKSTKNNRKL